MSIHLLREALSDRSITAGVVVRARLATIAANARSEAMIRRLAEKEGEPRKPLQAGQTGKHQRKAE